MALKGFESLNFCTAQIQFYIQQIYSLVDNEVSNFCYGVMCKK